MVVAPALASPVEQRLTARLAERVRELAGSYAPPTFAEAPGPDAALFLCAIDHRSGYARAHEVDGRGPYSGSELLWQLGNRAEREAPGSLRAASLIGATEGSLAKIFRIEGETPSGLAERVELWRDLAVLLIDRHGGSAASLIARCEGALGGGGGLIARLAEAKAYSDPLAKKGFLFAKIAARRGWFSARDPETWQVCADNVLMRVALRAGLVRPGPSEAVRAQTRRAMYELARAAEISPPLLDDLLWELGRSDPNVLGSEGGAELEAPPRPVGTLFY